MKKEEWEIHKRRCLYTELAVLAQRFRRYEIEAKDLEALKHNCAKDVLKACEYWELPIKAEDITFKVAESMPGHAIIVGFEVSSLTLP